MTNNTNMAELVIAIIDEPDVEKRSEIGGAIMAKYSELVDRIISLLEKDKELLQDLVRKAEGIK